MNTFAHALGVTCIAYGFSLAAWTIADSIIGSWRRIVAALRRDEPPVRDNPSRFADSGVKS